MKIMFVLPQTATLAHTCKFRPPRAWVACLFLSKGWEVPRNAYLPPLMTWLFLHDRCHAATETRIPPKTSANRQTPHYLPKKAVMLTNTTGDVRGDGQEAPADHACDVKEKLCKHFIHCMAGLSKRHSVRDGGVQIIILRDGVGRLWEWKWEKRMRKDDNTANRRLLLTFFKSEHKHCCARRATTTEIRTRNLSTKKERRKSCDCNCL